MSFPGGFKEQAYAEVKPHFEALWADAKAADKDFKEFKEFFKILIRAFGSGIKPYAITFAKEVEARALAGDAPPADPASSGDNILNSA